MIARVTTLFALLCLVLPARADDEAPSRAELEAREEQAFKQAAALVAPSVVRIQTVGGLDRVGQVLSGTGPTTGLVVGKEGWILSSSFNFANKPSSILVELADGRRLTAEVVAEDSSKMLVLLKVDADDLVPARPTPKESIKVGQWSLALGRAYGGPIPSMSIGIVSALDRVWGKAIQTDAKVSPVNYGGPLVSVDGKVQGILVPLSTRGTGDTAGVEWYDSGIGFAIPLEDVYRVLDRMQAGEDLKAGLLGVNLRGRGVTAGKPIVDRVRPTSPAAEAGLKPGDVIVEVDGEAVGRQADVRHALGGKYAGETVALKVARDDETFDVEVELVDELQAYESAFLGILPVREPVGGSGQPGVGVRHVVEEGPAAKAGLQKRDRIVRFDDEPIADAVELLDLVSRKKPGEKAEVAFQRDGEPQTVEVTLGEIPGAIPAELPTSAIPAPKPAVDAGDDDEAADDEAEDEGPQTGRFTRNMPAHEHDYWAYVPELYNADYAYGLMVWIHPAGDTMEATMFKEWRTICDTRGMILLGPKAEKIGGWNLNEAEFVKDAVEEISEQYNVDPQRVFLHTYAEGNALAWNLVFKHREHFRGISTVAGPLSGRPQENHPDFRLQVHLATGEKDPLQPQVQRTATVLKKMKYPVSLVVMKGREREYLPPERVEETARWADALDRI